MHVKPLPSRCIRLCTFCLALLLFASGAYAQSVPQESIYSDLEGQELLDALRADYAPDQTLGYDVARDTLFAYLQQERGEVRGVYTGYAIQLDPDADPTQDAFEKGINTEHTWPQSRGAGEEPARSDLHALYPTKENVNAVRSNDPFAEIPDAETDTWYCLEEIRQSIPSSNIDCYSEDDNTYPGVDYDGRFEPREDHKGNAARAAMYFYAIYQSAAEDDFLEVQRETFLAWNEADEVDEAEYARSAFIAERQGTVNPFILDTTLARRAFSEPLDGENQGTEVSPGDLVITEFMADPDAVNDSEGEYVELYNRTGRDIDLDGFRLVDAADNEAVVTSPLTIESGGLAVLARNSDPGENGGIEADYAFNGGLFLNNDGDTLVVTGPDGAEVAVLAYEEEHVVAGRSREIVHIELGFDGETEGDDYELATGTYGDGDFGSPGELGGTEIPVELTWFDAALDGREAVLRWETASEENNAGFEVQKRRGAERGEGAFERIGYVEGAGTTTRPRRYRFRSEALSPGTHVFRLRQVDYDGAFGYSEEVEVQVALAAMFELSEPNPNPFRDKTRLELTVGKAQEVRAELYDALGRRVQTLYRDRMSPARLETITVGAEGLASGLYFVRVEGEHFTESRRLVLVK